MGLGKTLQALAAVALSHHGAALADASARPVSLVVCPSTLVGHWLAEIGKFFPRQAVLKGTPDIGTAKQWSETGMGEDCNIVVVSYSFLRREVKVLSKILWRYCILDEGHLLKNPKTGTLAFYVHFYRLIHRSRTNHLVLRAIVSQLPQCRRESFEPSTN